MTAQYPWLDTDGKPKYIKRIAAVMHKKNLTKSELAELSGFSGATISDWLNNNVEPKITNFLSLAQTLGVSTDYLLGKRAYEVPEENYIYKLTGLSDKAIVKLRMNNKKIKSNKKSSGHDYESAHKLEALNYLIENMDTSPLLNNLYSYLLENHDDADADCGADYVAESYFVKIVKNLFSIKKKLDSGNKPTK